MKNYEECVYAGVLGKVIGVYMGRPFEGWPKDSLVKKWGMINGYVHEDLGKPLIVSDDDITGTFCFIRALEDSGIYPHLYMMGHPDFVHRYIADCLDVTRRMFETSHNHHQN